MPFFASATDEEALPPIVTAATAISTDTTRGRRYQIPSISQCVNGYNHIPRLKLNQMVRHAGGEQEAAPPPAGGRDSRSASPARVLVLSLDSGAAALRDDLVEVWSRVRAAFSKWDLRGRGFVSRDDWYRSVPTILGRVGEAGLDAHALTLFDFLDSTGAGELDYRAGGDLSRRLRKGASVDLDAKLKRTSKQDARGGRATKRAEAEAKATAQRFRTRLDAVADLRAAADKAALAHATKYVDPTPAPPVIDELRAALSQRLGRALDLFVRWDEGASGFANKRIFSIVMDALGLQCTPEERAALFGSLAEEREKGGPAIAYKGLKEALKEAPPKETAVAASESRGRPQQRQAAASRRRRATRATRTRTGVVDDAMLHPHALPAPSQAPPQRQQARQQAPPVPMMVSTSGGPGFQAESDLINATADHFLPPIAGSPSSRAGGGGGRDASDEEVAAAMAMKHEEVEEEEGNAVRGAVSPGLRMRYDESELEETAARRRQTKRDEKREAAWADESNFLKWGSKMAEDLVMYTKRRPADPAERKEALKSGTYRHLYLTKRDVEF